MTEKKSIVKKETATIALVKAKSQINLTDDLLVGNKEYLTSRQSKVLFREWVIGKITARLSRATATAFLSDEYETMRKLELTELLKKVQDDDSLTQLTYLNLSDCYLDSVPSEISVLKNLQQLHISNNSLKFLPDGLCYLSSLKVLNITHTQDLALF